MINISPSNEKAVVRHTLWDAVDREDFRGSKSTPPPSLDGLSISTTSCSQNNGNNKEKIKYDEDGEHENGSEFNDCSSSLSSQDSSNVVSSNTTKPSPKRSVFSQYWQETGQTRLTLRPVRSLSTPDLDGRDPSSLSTPEEPQRSSWTASAPDFDSESFKTSSLHSLLETPLPSSVTDAELLEDDGDSSFYDDDGRAQGFSDPPSRTSQLPQETTHAHRQPQRRRSILPPVPTNSNPALKATLFKTSARSWRKYGSFTNVEEYSRSPPPLSHQHKTRSLPGIRSPSSSSLLPSPGRSCLRRSSKYSPDTASQKIVATPPSPSSHSVPSMLPSSESPLLRARPLSRAHSTVSTSSVTFQEDVDVRHFEPPRERYSGKGWSDYFY